ncbi:MAG: CoA-binding protein [Gammaproteobacteria bacterium]
MADADGAISKMKDLSPFFRPRSIAVVGAGERITSSGGAVLRNLGHARYPGTVIPINPKGGEILGFAAKTSLRELASPAELVVVVVRPELILEVVRDAAVSGHKHLLILPGGFAEAGVEGVAREQALRELARQAGVTIAGPNCAGLIHRDRLFPFAATFLRDLPPGGGVAAISQSGAIAEEIIAAANRGKLAIGTVVSVGNALHLGVVDYLEYLGEQTDCHCVLLYIESIADRERFRAVARRVTARKPVVALLGGRTAAGAAAARNHTGADALADADAEAFCRDCGVIRVTSLRWLMLAAKAFGFYPRGIGRRVLVLSNSGGPGVITADCASDQGLVLPLLPAALGERLRAALPAEAAVANPIDLLADAREDRFALALAAALELGAEAFDAVLMIHVVPFMVDAGPIIAALAERAKRAELPLLHSMMGTLEAKADWFAAMEAAGVPTFDDAEEMAAAAGLLAQFPALH